LATQVRQLPKRERDKAKAEAEALSERFGKELREARVARKLSQHALGKLTGIGQAHVSQIELGRINVTLATMTILARAVGLKVDLIIEHTAPE
jgi:transcriptional regulator with XRE-family HTH domain